ncbi:MAG: hypothetical protein ACWA5A_14795 [Marinibacterium sp.]
MATPKIESWVNWQLKQGSHEFPGPDGGTCINEAALVVAGFAYREVTSLKDLPESFCPVISQFALSLNDAMPEGELLNRLRPYAARLSGSSDGRAMAEIRGTHLAMQAARVFAPLALEATDAGAAAYLRAAETPQEALARLQDLETRDWPGDIRLAIGAARRALARALNSRDAIYTAELAAVSAIRAAAVNETAWDAAIETLDQILDIGKKADPIEVRVIEDRAAKVLAEA